MLTLQAQPDLRAAHLDRQTFETHIRLSLALDGNGKFEAQSGMPFFEHMLHQWVRHSLIDLTLHCQGDLAIDLHHSVEDIGICLGQAFASALGDKKGIQRFGYAYAPLDESLSRVVIDLSGRPGLFMRANFTRTHIGDFDTQLVAEFFQAFVNHAKVTLHIDNLQGGNAHHQIESIFKATGLAFKQAIEKTERLTGKIASTKGLL